MAKLTRAETIAKNKADKRISAIYNRECNRIEIPMMKIPDIFKVGYAAIKDGADDAALTTAITKYVATIREN
jgi:uncharacterized membrane protein